LHDDQIEANFVVSNSLMGMDIVYLHDARIEADFMAKKLSHGDR